MVQLPDRYPDKALMKDRLFYGLHQHMCDSLQFMYQSSAIDYNQLLKAAAATEIESERGCSLRSKAGVVSLDQGTEGSSSRDASPIMATASAME